MTGTTATRYSRKNAAKSPAQELWRICRTIRQGKNMARGSVPCLTGTMSRSSRPNRIICSTFLLPYTGEGAYELCPATLTHGIERGRAQDLQLNSFELQELCLAAENWVDLVISLRSSLSHVVVIYAIYYMVLIFQRPSRIGPGE